MVRRPGVDQALMAIPELFLCPHCNGEIEIWTDEKRGKCSACQKIFLKENAKKLPPYRSKKEGRGQGEGSMETTLEKPTLHNAVEQNDLNTEMKVEVLKYIDDSGTALYYERFETFLTGSGFDHDKLYKMACEVFEKYGKNLACPPHSPTFLEYLGEVKTAKVICLRLPLEYFNHPIPEEKYRACFRKARSLLVDELLGYRNHGYAVAGAGPCLACEECAAEGNNKKCKKPTEKIYSLESLGVNIIKLGKTCFNIDLEWSGQENLADFVCAFGAVFPPQKSEIEKMRCRAV